MECVYVCMYICMYVMYLDCLDVVPLVYSLLYSPSSVSTLVDFWNTK